MTRAELIQKHYDALVAELVEKKPDLITRFDIDHAAPADATDKAVGKIVAALLEHKLAAEPALNQRFGATTKVARWNQLLGAARIAELASAHIVKRGGKKQLRYDVADLAKTYLGKVLLTEAGLARHKVLDKTELETLQAACANIEVELPETIEPTTTELFFAK